MQDEAHKPYVEGPMHSTAPMIDPGLTFASVTDKISSIVLKRKTSLAWFFGFAISFALFQLMLLAITNLVFVGIGLWGVNIPVAWGIDILNFVFQSLHKCFQNSDVNLTSLLLMMVSGSPCSLT